MTPTPKLRFVERVIAVPATDGEGRTVRILQQWWETKALWDDEKQNWWCKGEWRDVPLEKEL
jgi:hypothetical protein